MAKYKLTRDGNYYDTETDQWIPDDIGNRHRIEIQEWLDAGNTPDPAETVEEAQARKELELKNEANSIILQKYDDQTQRSAALGIGPVQEIKAFIEAVYVARDDAVSSIAAKRKVDTVDAIQAAWPTKG